MTTTRPFKFLLVAALMLASASPALALSGGPTLNIQPSKSSLAVNEQFTANVIIDTKTYSVAAVELHLTFPADKLQALSVAGGAFLPTELTPGTAGSGTATITVASGTSAKQGTGTIATITFKALVAGSAQIGFAGTTQVAAAGQSSNVVDTMTPATGTIAGGSGGTPTPTPAPRTVTIQNFAFSPTPLNIKVGDTVVWTNRDSAPHTVTGSGGMASPTLNTNDTYSLKFNTVGTFTYQCSIHSSMTGSVVVTANTPTPTPIRTPTPSPRILDVTRVATGPGETTILALVLSSLVTLLYVGYTKSNTFRRNEIKEIAADELQHPSDFKQ